MFRPLMGFWSWDSAMALVRDLIIPREDSIDPVDEFDEKDLDYDFGSGYENGLELFKPKWGEYDSWLLR